MIISSFNVKKIRETENNGKFKGVASVILDNLIAINEIKILKGKLGFTISTPKNRSHSIQPLNQTTRDVLQRLLVAAYSEMELREWDDIFLILKEEYQNRSFGSLTYDMYDVTKTFVFIPEKFQCVEV